MTQKYEIVVVGAGPAGLSAGMYISRQKVSCMVISKDLGGQMNLIPKLENYPGTIMSSGPLLARTLENQYLMFGGDLVYDTVNRIDETDGGLIIKTVRSEYEARAVVVAAGKVPNNLGLANEAVYQNKGVHYCTKCDAPFYQGRTTASVGVGAYLLESGILLSRMANQVYVIFQGSRLGGDPELIKSLKVKDNVELIPNSRVKTITGNGALQQITVADRGGEEKTIKVDGLFIEMGSKINLGFVKHLVELNRKGEIKVSNGGHTSHPAIFAAGDATDIPYKQIVAACGDGAAAGLSAFNYVEKLNGRPGVRADWKKQIGDTVFHF